MLSKTELREKEKCKRLCLWKHTAALDSPAPRNVHGIPPAPRLGLIYTYLHIERDLRGSLPGSPIYNCLPPQLPL